VSRRGAGTQTMTIQAGLLCCEVTGQRKKVSNVELWEHWVASVSQCVIVTSQLLLLLAVHQTLLFTPLLTAMSRQRQV